MICNVFEIVVSFIHVDFYGKKRVKKYENFIDIFLMDN